MAKTFKIGINLDQNELQNAVWQNLSSDPGSPVEGQHWYNTTSKTEKYYDGSTIQEVATGGNMSNAITRGSVAGGAGEMVVSAGADRTAKTYDAGNGILKSTSGVISAATAGTDYLTGASTNTLTNKTFDANGTGNSISNIEVADIATAALTTDIASSASATQIARADAIKTYVDNKITAMGTFAGSHDASGGAFPTTGTGSGSSIVAGDYWRVSVAGTISGIGELEVGDVLTATVDGADEASEFFAMQGNITDAVTSASASSTDNTIARFDSITGKVIQASNVSIDDSGSIDLPSGQTYKINGTDVLASVISKSKQSFNNTTDWVGGAAPYTFTVAAATHALTTDDLLQVQVRDDSGNVVETDVEIQADGDVVISSNTKFTGSTIIVG